MANSQPQPHFFDSQYTFFTLPLELRCKVYNFLMSEEHLRQEGIVRDIDNEKSMRIGISGRRSSRVPWHLGRKLLSSQLLRTCSAIYQEAMPILYGARTIRASNSDTFPSTLASIGTLACSFIKDIILEWQDLVHRLAYDPHTKTADLVIYNDKRSFNAPSRFGVKVFERLPALQTVTLQYHFWRQCGGSARAMMETFVEQIVTSTPRKEHFLTQIMEALQDRKNVVWRFDLYAYSGSRYNYTSSDNRREEQSAQPRYRIQFEVEVVETDVGGAKIQSWRIKNLVKKHVGGERGSPQGYVKMI